MYELHAAALDGSVKRTLAVLSRRAVDIDQGDRKGATPLMCAAGLGHSPVVKIFLSEGANLAIVGDIGFTALHMSAQRGHLAATKLLVKAGADLEAAGSGAGCTPLHLAANKGHSEVMRVLIEAGANPNSRALSGATSLYSAAQNGHVDAAKLLLRAKANPLLTFLSSSGQGFVPLDMAAGNGHLEVVRELIQEHGVEGCGGVSGGVDALRAAAENQHMDIMNVLTSAGVVDTGTALIAAAGFSRESSMKFLLQQQEWKSSGERATYFKACDPFGRTAMLRSIFACRSCSPRTTRLLVDAGADTTTAVRLLPDEKGVICFDDTPLALAELLLSGKKIKGKDATESQLHSLEATRRLLMRVEAVHAVSWLWANDVPSVTHAAAKRTGRSTKATSTPLILRQRTGRPRVLLAALLRHSSKPY